MRRLALSKFGAMVEGVKERKIVVMIKEVLVIDEKAVHIVEEANSCKIPFVQYLKHGNLPSDPIAARRLRFKANRFTMLGEELYERTPEGILLKCLDDERAQYVMREVHEESCGNDSGGRSLAQKILRQGYFWPTMVEDAKEFVKKCESCQRYAGLLHSLATPLEALKVACPFDQWGIDIIGPFAQVVAQKKFLIVTVEYFAKWVEAEAVSKISGKEDLKVQQNFTAVGNPQANGLVEVTNRTLLQHLKTRLEGAKGSWVEELPRVLWAYRTTPRTATGRCFDLSVIEEGRECAYAKILRYKSIMTRNYNRRVKPRNFQVGDLVLKKVEVLKHVEKLDPTWEGPYKGNICTTRHG
ncbi:UNVERIFIED_CONTAM: hypothetical protein Sindi_1835100 [Sesamum indicum]